MRKLFLAAFSLFVLCSCNLTDIDALHGSDKRMVEEHSFGHSFAGRKLVHVGSPFRVNEISSLLDTSKIAPTHKAIRVLPRDMEQLHRLERDSSLVVLYHPFDCEAEEEIDTDNNESAFVTADMSEIMEECLESFDEEDVITILPVYVFWPEGRAIPSDIDYEFCYDAVIPDIALRDSIISNLAREESGSGFRSNVAGRLMTYDNRLNQYVPLPNAKIGYYPTSSVLQFEYTDALGYFVLVGVNVNSPVSVTLINEKFAVRDSLTSNVVSVSLGQLSGYMISDNFAEINLGVSFERDVFKAAAYYFYGSNALLNNVTKYDSTGNIIDILVIDHPGDYYGRFYGGSTPHINIWNYHKYNYLPSKASSAIFGTVLHELGHATNYATLGDAYMEDTNRMVKESFASFFGWYNVKEYYASVASTHASVNAICTQGRQYWYPGTTSNENYTPLFVDLYDNYNQQIELSPYCNYDDVSGVPASVIANIALGPKTIQEVFKKTRINCVGYYFSFDECMEFMDPYTCYLPSISIVFNNTP